MRNLLFLLTFTIFLMKGFGQSSETTFVEMVFVKGDTFLMGTPDFDNRWDVDEKPQHKVILSDFFIGKYEISQGQWFEIMGYVSPISKKWKKDNDADTYPIIGITWFDAIQFCNKLSQKEGLPPYYIINGNIISIDHRFS